jgi:Holliday junction DNA helicase RuvA
MICRITGQLEAIENGKAHLALEGGLTYEVLLPAYASGRLGASIDSPITLHTLHYMEGSSQGTTFIPRLAGFLTETDKAFFELFTTVKGIGSRKALRAMTLDTAQIANAIADRDTKMLQTLPEIGKRMSETIVATLHGKVDQFVSGPSGEAPTTGELPRPGRAASREALEVLLQLGENRTQAVAWIDQVLTRDPEIDDAQVIITEVFKVKSGV